VRVLVGTSGYSYAPWKGRFYPEKMKAEEMLAFYATKLSTVEINNTFYRMPKESVVASWGAQVPESFRFVLKASQRITHMKRLKDAAEPTAYFVGAARALGAKLGAALFQLPPNLKKDLPRLEAFLTLLPTDVRSAFEFRHPSWFDDDVYAALRGKNAALCVAEDEDLKTPMVATADWGYLRLRRQDYGEEALRAYAGEILAQPWGDAFVFFKHEEEGKGPELAAQLIALIA